jgi:DNA-binding MarR family transcriptional regulator
VSAGTSPTIGRAFTIVALSLVTFTLIVGMTGLAEDGSIKGRVFDDATFEPITGATVTLTSRDNGTVLGATVTDANGMYGFSPGIFGNLTLIVQAEGYEDSSEDFYVPEIFNLSDVVMNTGMSSISPPGPSPSPTPTTPYLLYAAIAAIVGFTSLVMYSKIKKENLLRHAVRSRIYEYVKENPGQHYRAILKDLDLTMGVLTYHLNRLEKAEYLKSRQDGMYRRFFVTGRRTEVRFFLSDIQESILGAIRDNQGISQTRIAEGIGVTRKVVNYHVKILDQAGLIYVEDRGRETACFARECRASASL